MNNTLQIILFLLLQASILLAQPSQDAALSLFAPVSEQTLSSDFSTIDAYVLGLRTRRNISEAELAQVITMHSTTKMEKARAIFIWLANNIAYDTNYRIYSKEVALRQGRGVCQAYSELFKSLGELAGLEVMVIAGDSKPQTYRRPSDIDRRGHAWNAVKVDDGRWALVDATWGAGYVNNKKFTRKLSEFWFDTSPEFFVFTHLPKEENWQLLDKPVTRDEFLRMPPLSPELVAWGFNPDATLSYFINTRGASFPEQFSIDLDWKINSMPVSNELKVGGSYEFEFILPQDNELAIVSNNRDWIHFVQEDNRHSVIFTPKSRGQAVLTVKLPNGKYGGIFKYDVRN